MTTGEPAGAEPVVRSVRAGRALRPVELAGEDFRLRPFTVADEPAVAVALADPGVLRWTAGTAVIRRPAGQRAAAWLGPRIDSWLTGTAAFAIADPESDDLLGSVTLRDVHRVPDQALAAYWVTPAARGRGLAARALEVAVRWGFSSRADDGPGLHRITLDHALVNQASCRVATAAGFRLEGTMRDQYVEPDGHRHDAHLHARLTTDPPAS